MKLTFKDPKLLEALLNDGQTTIDTTMDIDIITIITRLSEVLSYE